MSDLFDREYECALCGNRFTSKQVKTSAVRTKVRERDFHAYYKGESPIYYGVICCPNCGYAKFEKEFKDKLLPNQKELLKSMISSNWRYQDFSYERTLDDAIKVHLIALANYRVLSEKAGVIAKLYLRLAWFYREKEMDREEFKYMHLSLESFISCYEHEDFDDNPEGELEMIYLIGEINRRVGCYADAIKWFQICVNHEFAYKNRMLKQYARDQWALSSDAYKREKSKEKSLNEHLFN